MNILRLEDKLNIISKPINAPVYDFDFELFFNCKHPICFADNESCVLRIGAIQNYQKEYEEKLSMSLRPINSPEEHALSSELSKWYPLISEFTPRSIWADEFPSVDEIQDKFGWLVFIKGSRQTSKHNPALAIAFDETQYQNIKRNYHHDPILRWQQIAIREFVELQPVSGAVPGKVKPSLEFRSFWWNGDCVGWGQYWYQLPSYRASDIESGLEIARVVAQRIQVPFLVIDIAKTQSGDWLVIECNDAQESGYAGIIPQLLWQRILQRVSA